MRTFQIILAASVALFIAAKPKTYSRSKPPTKWDKAVLSVFEDNAYSLLEGQRPTFDQQVKKEEKKEEKEKEANGDFDRSDMMKKLKSAEESLAECINNEKTFKAASSKIESSADLFVMMGRTLFNSDPDYNEEDYYLKQAEEMTSNAKLIKVFVKKGDYDGAVRAFSNVKKSCDNCHSKFR